jgi:hypothetical protein
MYNVHTALELSRARNKAPAATLVASATTAVARKAAVPKKAPTNVGKYEKKYGFDTKSSAELAKQQKISIDAIPQQEKVEFGGMARAGYASLIGLNAIGDVLDLSIFLFGVGEGISLVYDQCLLPINIYFLGMNPKNNKAANSKLLKKVLIRFLGIENIPGVSIFYLRTVFAIKVYRQRARAAEQGVPA